VRGGERVLELEDALGRRVGAREDRIDHGQPRALEPQASEVVVRGGVVEHAPEGGVADEKGRVGVLAEGDVLRLREEDAKEDG
jgi:hypothetical protein